MVYLVSSTQGVFIYSQFTLTAYFVYALWTLPSYIYQAYVQMNEQLPTILYSLGL